MIASLISNNSNIHIVMNITWDSDEQTSNL